MDTGSAYSILPFSSTAPTTGPALTAASGASIKAWGCRHVQISAGGRRFSWRFLQAEVAFPIIGALVQTSWLGSLARSCNVATDRLVYQDARGLSAAETWLGFRIGGRTKPKDAGLICEVGPVGNCCRGSGWQAQSRRVAQTSARANGAVAGSSPGHSGFKACRLMYSCW